MIAGSVMFGIVALALVALWVRACYWSRSQHGGGGEGALTVRYPVERIEAETSSGGRHRLRQVSQSLHGR